MIPATRASLRPARVVQRFGAAPRRLFTRHQVRRPARCRASKLEAPEGLRVPKWTGSPAEVQVGAASGAQEWQGAGAADGGRQPYC